MPLIDQLSHWLKRKSLQIKPYGFRGDFNSWQEAKSHCKGYDDTKILQQVLSATRDVIEGKAAYERDGVAFTEPSYDWFMLSCLFYVQNQQKTLHVIDFGGALGSIYFQHKNLIKDIPHLHWMVVEQASFVETGKKEIANGQLDFFPTMKEASQAHAADLILFRCVLPYLEFPYQILEEAKSLCPAFIMIDKNPFIEGKDRICIQKVPTSIIDSSYPAWFFNKQKMLEFMSDNYEPVMEQKEQDMVNIPSSYDGILFRRK